ncbi:N-6 DNA methylase [Chlorobium phaeobacteroides]|uniref:site-specific DNA-methyltransferase (adenine-specific) n=1 Tax=Chlorobium phaeobacteroides (strain DSM 266 / SMG 266 / 2430) TaxID=290317 RepID=A1BEW6_CHLPD|nr:N-6 DNA methylase [Chlorobium phaeobacteroides]ABL64943.1 N-6 DNA methylase [Chlorobium phaeobacteroides DSM 266]
MLDTATKRRIDSARDILVGKVPDPKSQVEQITIALIYKFMDDMDAESEELGGVRTFFTKEFARYGWAKLMRSGLGGHETLNLYAEAISSMPENPGIPALFRSIFKNAYLPYRDPETLKSFLKIIDEFEYDHSERLGDAFEYLLSVLGSQGDAGQFRTPRHIIDFMVAVLDPKKEEKILDPACGTAGFLISAYKHILRANTDADGNSLLTPDDKGRLAQNINGYDISPDMVRLSLVNLYLHGFADPHIDEYDTLTSLDKWNEHADVILANPPFMSPKGGIKPHKRFSIQATRSEVLFVDYMAEHLKPNGRAGIIVPEGIIFQSGTAYKSLRKMLVDTGLVAVISLPAGVFQPYSGVKTSIIILDKSIAKRSNTIAFFKVDNDGFGLGAQRRVIVKNDLPTVATEIAEYLGRLRRHESVEDLQLSQGLIVPKEKIAENGDYNLSGERYRENIASNHSFPLVYLGNAELFRVESGGTPKSDVEELWNGGFPWATLADLPSTDFITEIRSTRRTISERGLRESSAKMIPENSVIVSTRATIGRIAINRIPMATNQGFKNVIIEDKSKVISEYVALALTKLVPTMNAWATGGTFKEIPKSRFCELEIPLPPLEVQKKIVAKIEGYQKVIDGARAVLDNYRPHIPINPDWPIVKLETVSTIVRGSSPRPQGDPKYFGGPVPRLMVADITRDGMYTTPLIDSLTELGAGKSRFMKSGEVIITVSGNPGLPTILAVDACIHDGFVGLRELSNDVVPEYLYFSLLALHSQHGSQSVGAVFKNLTSDQIREFTISLPPLATQQAIVAEIEAEQALVNANSELIERFENKIQATITRVWVRDGAL